jgi:ABC-type Mn2+/Zn2+ transport system permease subunit
MLEKKIAWISKIETRDDALEVEKVASYAFFFLAALQIVLFLAVKSTGAIVVAGILVAGAAALRLHSRPAAAVLLGLSCLEALATVAKMFGAHPGMGSNVVVAGVMVWVAVRAVQATWALQRMPDEDEDEDVSAARGR